MSTPKQITLVDGTKELSWILIIKPCTYKKFNIRDIALCAVAGDGALIKRCHPGGVKVDSL